MRCWAESNRPIYPLPPNPTPIHDHHTVIKIEKKKENVTDSLCLSMEGKATAARFHKTKANKEKGSTIESSSVVDDLGVDVVWDVLSNE